MTCPWSQSKSMVETEMAVLVCSTPKSVLSVLNHSESRKKGSNPSLLHLDVGLWDSVSCQSY